MSEITWEFPFNGGGASDGHNNGALDTFAGQRLSSMVREVIQNSLDAKPVESNNEPVKVSFSLHNIDASEFDGFKGLAEHARACEATAEEQQLSEVQAYYATATETLLKKRKIPVLVISDSNTTGLTGPLDKQRGAWFALTKGTGITQKESSSSLGSFGHGSKAPFLMAGIRTLFYYTKIRGSEGPQVRFQGKSIWLSHEHPVAGHTTQGTGFYGYKDGLLPLIDASVPKWATDLREHDSDDFGTSIIIPYTTFRDDLFPETRITVVANFFYAIKEGQLEVVVDGEKIDSSNIHEQFYACKAMLEDEQDEIDVDHIEGCFKSIHTLINPTHYDRQEIPHFGRIDWYLRLDDSIDYKNVAISRESGMLITRRPARLLRFGGFKPFDMFVFVNPGKGSEHLKRLENPEHNNFEFDRIRGATDEADVKKSYNKLVQKVKAVLEKFAQSSTDKEEDITELANYLFSSSSTGESDDNAERGTKITVLKGSVQRPKRTVRPGEGRVQPGGGGTGGAGENPGKGNGGGATGGSNAGGSGGPGGDSGSVAATFQLQNLRIVRPAVQVKGVSTKLYFDVGEPGQYEIQLTKAGETSGLGGGDNILFIVDGKKVSKKRISIAEGEGIRHSITIELADPADANFAMEGWINEIS